VHHPAFIPMRRTVSGQVRQEMSHPVSNGNVFKIQAALCQAMGHPLRMQIMYILRDGPMNVNEIASAAHTLQTTISRNLAILRNARIVTTYRDGSSIFYQVSNPKLMSVCDLMREVLIEQIRKNSRFTESDEVTGFHLQEG
jgi:ArsR family transcriptional regulator